MTSNSPANAAGAGWVAGLSLLLTAAACTDTAPRTETPAPSARPAPALDEPGEAAPRPERIEPHRIAQIRSVEMRFVERGEPIVDAIVHHDDMDALRQPVLVTVQVDAPYDNLARTSSPIIIINGIFLPDTIVTGDNDVLQGIVRDAEALDGVEQIRVAWLGAIEQTASEPFEVNVAEQLGRLRREE